MVCEVGGYLPGILAVPVHSQTQCFNSLGEEEGVERGAGGAQQLIGIVGNGIHKVNIPADEHTPDGGAMPIQKFCRGMEYKVYTIAKRLLQVGGSKSIVDGDLDLVTGGNGADGFQVD